MRSRIVDVPVVDVLVVVCIVLAGIAVAAVVRPDPPVELPLACTTGGEFSGAYIGVLTEETYDDPSAPWFSGRKAVALTEALHQALPEDAVVQFASPVESLRFGGLLGAAGPEFEPGLAAHSNAQGTLRHDGKSGSVFASIGVLHREVPTCGPSVTRRLRLHDGTIVDLSPGAVLAYTADGTVLQVSAENDVLTQDELLDIVASSDLLVTAPIPKGTSEPTPLCGVGGNESEVSIDRPRLAALGRALATAWDDGPGRRVEASVSLSELALQSYSTSAACVEVRTSVGDRSGTLRIGVSGGAEAPQPPDPHDPELDRSRDHVLLDGGAVSARSRNGSPSVEVTRPSGTVCR